MNYQPFSQNSMQYIEGHTIQRLTSNLQSDDNRNFIIERNFLNKKVKKPNLPSEGSTDRLSPDNKSQSNLQRGDYDNLLTPKGQLKSLLSFRQSRSLANLLQKRRTAASYRQMSMNRGHGQSVPILISQASISSPPKKTKSIILPKARQSTQREEETPFKEIEQSINKQAESSMRTKSPMQSVNKLTEQLMGLVPEEKDVNDAINQTSEKETTSIHYSEVPVSNPNAQHASISNKSILVTNDNLNSLDCYRNEADKLQRQTFVQNFQQADLRAQNNIIIPKKKAISRNRVGKITQYRGSQNVTEFNNELTADAISNTGQSMFRHSSIAAKSFNHLPKFKLKKMTQRSTQEGAA